MSRKALILPQADRDIDEAFAWYLSEANGEVAFRFLDAVEIAIAGLQESPGIGRRWPFRRPVNSGLRSARVPSFGRYLIFYRETAAAIEVVRVLHGMRDIERIVDEP